MSWVRLYLIVEGQTERKFVEASLRPHLEAFEVEVRPSLVLTSRRLGTRGGGLVYARLANDIQRRLKQDPHAEARFSTMIDFYALPSDFPGFKKAAQRTAPSEKVRILEEEMASQFNDSRFIPYLQLHEFEALLYCDLGEIEKRVEGAYLKNLRNEIKAFETPEDINDKEQTAPSRRLIKHLPSYDKSKVRVGAPAAAAIGLGVLREKCPHFGSWLAKLEGLGKA